ncbi:hypothetical protein E4U42_001755 [Claviceps africana]|uniref:Sulfhydryl oxidase n=1 Tax=Claviceps africana TaxID=83212 RepID=A0A8K0J1G3_9HYPO|nr:hypothetical protein E4U42_001755 [Claviceps africana]
MARRQHLTLTALVAVAVFLSITYLFAGRSSPVRGAAPFRAEPDAARSTTQKPMASPSPESESNFKLNLDAIPSLSEGDSIAPKLENATLKAELGRATWKFLHTMVARFPEKPSESDRKTLESFFHIFGRLYPCGDCARHFREMLTKYPPQTSSRNAAAGWLCSVHNVVNERLKKPQFDCTKIGDFYDCGCGDDKKDKKAKRQDQDQGQGQGKGESVDDNHKHKEHGRGRGHDGDADRNGVKRGIREKRSASALGRWARQLNEVLAADTS